jgi:L-arabinose isomerase
MKTKNKLLYQYIEEEFFKKIEEQDIEFHFENYHSHYAIAQDIIIDSKDRQSIDQILGERVVIIKDFR